MAPPQVLVVDDYKGTADSLAQMRAVQLAAMQPFHYLISDVVMDSMNGIEAAIAIRRLHPECKILLISGNHDTNDLLLEAKELGADFDVLAKPFPPELMLDILRNNYETQHQSV
jgi:CheY-like chemotaxis protein